jgi:peptidoglycan/LPS O-acetylase OafA/YrhL
LAWSISTEFFFYIVYPFLVFAVLRIRRPRTGLVAVAVFSLAFMALLAIALSNFASIEELAKSFLPRVVPGDVGTDASFYRWLFYYSPYVRVGEFVLGCLTAQLFMIVRDLPVARRERLYAGLVFAVAVVWLVGFGFIYAYPVVVPNGLGAKGTFGFELVHIVHFSALNFGVAVPLAVVIFYTARYEGMTANFLALPVMVWLGEISYSLYVVHTWTLRPLIRPAISWNEIYQVDAILRVTMGIAFTIIVSAGTYMMIEQPARRYLRALLMNGKTAKAAPYVPNEVKGT